MSPIISSLTHNWTASGGGAIEYAVGTYYPMFAIKAANDTNVAIPAANTEVPMRRALSFDTNNTTVLNGSESISQIITILNASKYTCNPDFGSGGAYISGIMIRHYDSTGTLESSGEASFTFSNTTFNIYDDACNAPAIRTPPNTNVGSVTKACGTITSVYLDNYSGSNPQVYLNQSTANVTHSSQEGWSQDSGDYCFIGVGTKVHAQNSDSLDNSFSNDNGQSGTSRVYEPGLAFGISDSDGSGTINSTPREGISRRADGYPSLVTNYRALSNTLSGSAGHSGSSDTGYFIVYGRYLSNAP